MEAMTPKQIIEYYKMTGLWFRGHIEFPEKEMTYQDEIDWSILLMKIQLDRRMNALKRTCDKQMDELNIKYGYAASTYDLRKPFFYDKLIDKWENAAQAEFQQITTRTPEYGC